MTPFMVKEIKSDGDGDIDLASEMAKLVFNSAPSYEIPDKLPKTDPTFADDILKLMLSSHANHIVNQVFKTLSVQIPERMFALMRAQWEKILLEVAQQFISKCDDQKMTGRLIAELVDVFKAGDINMQAIQNAIRNCFIPSEVKRLLARLVPSRGMFFSDIYEKEMSVEDELRPLLTNVFKKFAYSEFPKVCAQIITLMAKENLSAYRPWGDTNTNKGDHPEIESCLQAADRIQVKRVLKRILLNMANEPLDEKIDPKNIPRLFSKERLPGGKVPTLIINPQDLTHDLKLEQVSAIIDRFCQKTGAKQVHIKYTKEIAQDADCMIAINADNRVLTNTLITDEKTRPQPRFSSTMKSQLTL